MVKYDELPLESQKDADLAVIEFLQENGYDNLLATAAFAHCLTFGVGHTRMPDNLGQVEKVETKLSTTTLLANSTYS